MVFHPIKNVSFHSNILHSKYIRFNYYYQNPCEGGCISDMNYWKLHITIIGDILTFCKILHSYLNIELEFVTVFSQNLFSLHFPWINICYILHTVHRMATKHQLIFNIGYSIDQLMWSIRASLHWFNWSLSFMYINCVCLSSTDNVKCEWMKEWWNTGNTREMKRTSNRIIAPNSKP